MTVINIGLLHPGTMGISVAAALQGNGHRVFWLPEGRSERTLARAEEHDLQRAASLEAMGQQCSLIVSLCPPHFAEEIATQVINSRFEGIFLEANGIAPQKSRAIGERMLQAGIGYADGGIIGPPVSQPHTTRLFLSGPEAGRVQDYFAFCPLDTQVLGVDIGLASAIKMCDSAFQKGLLALLYETLGAAEHLNVRHPLMEHWQRDKNGVGNISIENDRLTRSATKAWRFIGEMEEVEATLASCPGLTPGFAQLAQDTYRRLAHFRPGGETPSEERIVAAMLASR